MFHFTLERCVRQTMALTVALCLALADPLAVVLAQALTQEQLQQETAARPEQPVEAEADAESPPPAWDVTALLGWRGVRLITDREFNRVDYDHRLLAGVLAGRHWTPHVKTEVEIATTAESDTVSFSQVGFDVPNFSTRPYIYTNHRIRDTVFSAAGLYQFGEDAWFHPHVGAGIEIARTHDGATTSRQTLSLADRSQPIVIAEASSQSTRTVSTRGFLTAGFKAYANERVFVRGDLRVAAGQAPANVSARFGVGFDFPTRTTTPSRKAQPQPEPRTQTQAQTRAQSRVRAPEAAAAPDLRSYVERLPAGSRVKVRLESGESFKAILMGTSEDDVILKPRTRRPKPERRVAFADVEFIELQLPGSTGKVVGVSIAAAAATVVGVLFLIAAVYDD